MKKPIFLTTVALVGLAPIANASFKDFIVKEDIYSIVAESEQETALIPNSTFLPKRKITTLVEYCESIGGVANYNKENILDFKIPVTCTAPNSQGFEATTKYLKKGYNDYVVVVKHESNQPNGYAMKSFNESNDIAKKTSPVEFNSAMRDFGTNFYNYYGYCVAKGGTYLVSNAETEGAAVDGSEYLLKGYGVKESSIYSEGKHWCVNTNNPDDEYTIAVARNSFNGVITFKPTKGVSVNQIKKYSGALPWYTASSKESSIVLPEQKANNELGMSKSPTQPITALAVKTIASKNTVLERQNGSVLEGVYLGQNDSGCQLAAVMSAPDQSYGHTIVYDDKKPAKWIMNYKQCSNAPIEYTGESFERSLPASITQEYNRVLNMCRIRGAAMGSFMGYNIDCSRQGSMAQPVHEVTITKKDKLVIRTYER